MDNEGDDETLKNVYRGTPLGLSLLAALNTLLIEGEISSELASEIMVISQSYLSCLLSILKVIYSL